MLIIIEKDGRRCDMCIENLNKAIKKMDVWDIGLTKLAVASGVLFIITIWGAAMTWVHSVNPWWFFVAFVIFAIRPWSKMFNK